MRDKRALFMQLLGEEIDTKIAMLTSRGRRSDANHLTGAALKGQQIPQSDVVAWDGDRVWRETTFNNTHTLRAGGSHFSLDGFSMVATVNWVRDTVGNSLDTTSERVVVCVLVVVTHVSFRFGDLV